MRHRLAVFSRSSAEWRLHLPLVRSAPRRPDLFCLSISPRFCRRAAVSRNPFGAASLRRGEFRANRSRRFLSQSRSACNAHRRESEFRVPSRRRRFRPCGTARGYSALSCTGAWCSSRGLRLRSANRLRGPGLSCRCECEQGPGNRRGEFARFCRPRVETRRTPGAHLAALRR